MRKFSYKNLFKKLIDLDMTNGELIKKQGLVKNTFYKINNGQIVTTDILLRIWNALNFYIKDTIQIKDIKEVK